MAVYVSTVIRMTPKLQTVASKRATSRPFSFLRLVSELIPWVLLLLVLLAQDSLISWDSFNPAIHISTSLKYLFVEATFQVFFGKQLLPIYHVRLSHAGNGRRL